jgi:phosphate uptake regulator
VKSSDFISVEEQGNALVVSSEKSFSEMNSVSFDISDMHERTIDRVLTAIYTKGVDELVLIYKNKETLGGDMKTRIPVIDVVQRRLSSYINFEIIEQGENYCKIHDVSTSSSKEFYPMIRRAFLLLKEMGAQLYVGVRDDNKELLKSMSHKHDVIAKFCFFCMRVLNKEGYKTGVEGVFSYNPRNIIFYFQTMQAMHEITDLFKEAGKFIIFTDVKLHKESCEILKDFLDCLDIFYDLFYKFDTAKINEISRRRIGMERRFYELSKGKLTGYDLLFVGRVVENMHHFAFWAEAEIAIRCEQQPDLRGPKAL